MGSVTADGADRDLDYVPGATPATADALCWIWAAIPPKEGRIHVSRVAKAVDRSPRTVQRWIAAAPDRDLDPRALKILRTRAILRGHGDYLWPALNEPRAAAAQMLSDEAENNLQLLLEYPDQIPAGWKNGPALQSHMVYLYYHPEARVFGIASGSTRATANNLRRMRADIIDLITAPTKWHAQVIKHDILDLVADARCLPPRALIPTGRTETWRRRVGDVDLAAAARPTLLRR